jgi:endogenous inhibitor of DNA gyrase (YacG/DUF329 family)
MGEWFQTIADVEATPDAAEDLAAATLAWLIASGIVVAEETDCALSGLAHAPGPRYLTAVVEADPSLFTLRTNGVQFDTGRAVHYSMGADEVTCPRCQHTVALTDERGAPNDAWQDLADTIDVWYSGGTGERPCPHCGYAVGLNDWTWSPPWGFGYLGITFWNWPPLHPRFLAGIGERLGHRTVHPYGKV